MKREGLLERIAARIESIELPHPTRVAVDGIDAAGKTRFADELALILEKKGRHVIRASVDGFHNPRQVRYRRGVDSPEGYYLDSFNLDALQKQLLDPLGPGGNLLYLTSVFDSRKDTFIAPEHLMAPRDSILLFDGVFSLRPELVEGWDYKIYLEISFETCLERVVERDRMLFDSIEGIQQRYLLRYIPGQRIYMRVSDPSRNADVVINNEIPQEAYIVPRKTRNITNKNRAYIDDK